MLEENIKYLSNEKIPNLAGVYLLIDEGTNQSYIDSSVNMRLKIAHHRSLLQSNKHPNKVLPHLFLAGHLVFKVLVLFLVAYKLKVREAEQFFIEAFRFISEQIN